MHRPTKLKMSDLNPHLACVLCDGYFVDATTIVECLHSFCRACIVKYLETNKFCPICDVQVHKTKPLLSIRSDKTLQDVVYKLVPRLYQDEMKKRVEFYGEHPEEGARCTSEERGECAKQRFIYTPDETISLSIEYGNGDSQESPIKKEGEKSEDKVPQKRYLQCPAAITVGHLKKFITAKYAVPPSYQVEISYAGDFLNEDYTLMDVAYIFAWRRSGPMKLFYQVKNRPAKRRKISHPVPEVTKPVVPIIKEPETKKPVTEFPTLRLLPSPSADANEFKFVLKTVSCKKDEKSNELTPNQNCQRSASKKEQNPVPSAGKHVQSSPGSVNVVPEVPLLSVDSKPGDTVTISQPVTSQNVVTTVAAITSSSSDGRTVPMISNAAMAKTTPTLQPILCSTYRTSTPLKPQTGSKRATRSRAKNRSIQRPPLVRLAPYPPPQRTNSPTTNTLVSQVNHYPSSPVTCFTAPPVTCLSTAPVNCLGTVSVSYLPNAAVSCFEPPAANTATAVNVNNMVTTSVNNVPMTTNYPNLSTDAPCTQVPVATTLTTSVTNPIAQTVSTPPTSCPVTLPKLPMVTVSSSTPFVGTTPTCIGRSAQISSVPMASMNSHPMPATIPLAPKLALPKSRENKILKSTVAPKNKTIPFLASSKSNSYQIGVSQAPPTTVTSVGTSVCNSLTTASHVVCAPSMPVISVDVSPSPNTTTSIPTSVFNNIGNKMGVKAATNVSFSVNSLLPTMTASQNSSVAGTEMKVNSSTLSIAKPLSYPPHSDPVSFPIKETAVAVKKDTKEESSQLLGINTSLQSSVVESLSTSPVSTEKNSINTPFKEVKSSITAEFSDNDDLGCQPDLVVDEQKLDSSDNEDEAEVALRRKITAIAEKDDEVDVELDTETDSGRASDVSNQARSSCDDDIGSPLPRVSEVERPIQAATNNINSLPVNFVSTTTKVAPVTSTRSDESLPAPSKPNGIDHIINNLHRNHERKDNIGALDLSTSCRKAGDQSPRPRQRPVANPPVLDAKHRQQTCLSAPTKQHTACAPAPAPKHPTSLSFPIRTLSASRHGMMPGPAATAENSVAKIPPVTIPHFSPTSLINPFPVKTPQTLNASHFCRTPQIPMPSNANNPFQTGQQSANSRQGKTNSSRSTNSTTPSMRKSPSATNGRRDTMSPRHTSSSPSTPVSPHHRLSPCATPPKSAPSLPTAAVNNVLPSVPSTSSYKVSRQQTPIYKKADSYKYSPHHNRFKGSNLTVINPDPNGYRQKIVIKNLDCRPNNHRIVK